MSRPPQSVTEAVDMHLRLLNQHRTKWYRDYIQKFWASYHADNASRVPVKMVNQITGEVTSATDADWIKIANQMAWEIGESETIYVSPDICHVVGVMSKGMPEDMLSANDIPFGRFGALFFGQDIPYEEYSGEEHAYRPVAVRSAVVAKDTQVQSWGSNDQKAGITTILFAAVDTIRPDIAASDLCMIEMTGWQYGTWWTTAADPESRTQHEMAPHVAAFRKFLLCLFRFMNDEIIEVGREKLPRAVQRRMGRAGLPIPEDGTVKVLRLRRVRHVGGSEEGQGTRVEWSHRWWVDGHWRHYRDLRGQETDPGNPGGSRSWVRPYVKGPDWLPVVTKQKTVVVNR